jgi:hypothetical protein
MFIHINKSPKIEDSEMVHIIEVPENKILSGWKVFQKLLWLDRVNYNKELEI